MQEIIATEQIKKLETQADPLPSVLLSTLILSSSNSIVSSKFICTKWLQRYFYTKIATELKHLHIQKSHMFSHVVYLFVVNSNGDIKSLFFVVAVETFGFQSKQCDWRVLRTLYDAHIHISMKIQNYVVFEM